jgi:RNA polymerase sigma-70 factor (ECF subfamily)
MADSVGVALLVVLDRLAPAERLAFVLHDMFAVPFEEIAAVVGRSPAATRQLASRARRRVQGAPVGSHIVGRRATVDAFLAALRAGDLDALLAVLDPDLVVRSDAASSATGAPREIRGARVWAEQAIVFARQAAGTRPALVDGALGAVWAPHGRLRRALAFTFDDGKIARIDVVGEPERLRRLDIAALDV